MRRQFSLWSAKALGIRKENGQSQEQEQELQGA